MGAGAVLHLSLAHEVAVGELPGAAVAVAAAVVGMEDDVPGVDEGLAQGVPLVGVVPRGTAVDDHDRSRRWVCSGSHSRPGTSARRSRLR